MKSVSEMMSYGLFAAWGVIALLSSCSGGSSDRSVEPSQPTLTSPSFVDSSNFTPVFVDVNGVMDSSYRANGFVYSNDLFDAVQKGDPDARFVLAQMYAYGICGAPADRRKAFKLYRVLADEQMPMAEALAGYMLFYGLGQEEDTEEGLRLMVRATEKNCGLAYYFLGNFYANNAPDTEENRLNAKVCFAKAAALGYK